MVFEKSGFDVEKLVKIKSGPSAGLDGTMLQYPVVIIIDRQTADSPCSVA